MKTAFFVPFVLLLGLVIGGWTPKEELRALRKEKESLNAKLAERDKSQRFDAITRIVQIPDRAKQPKAAAATQPARGLASGPSVKTNAASRFSAVPPPSTNASVKADEPQKQPLKPEDLRARIDEAKELWMTRVEIARAQWLERAKLSPDEAARFDNAINAMNENLYAAMKNLADVAASSDSLTPEIGVRAFSEMTSVLVQTYDELNTVVPAAQQAEVGKLELTDFIDPAIAEPLVAIQDKLDSLPRERRPGARLGR